MARVIGDVCAPLGKYIDRQTNEEKTKWGRCGVLIETDKGMRIKLDMIPAQVGESGLWMSVFEPREQQQQNAAPTPAQTASQPDLAKEDTPF